MLAISRRLMCGPELIMFDEPSLGLAPTVAKEVLRAIRALSQKGLTILLVERNVAVSLKLSRHAYVPENGRIVMSSAGSALLNDTSACHCLSRFVALDTAQSSNFLDLRLPTVNYPDYYGAQATEPSLMQRGDRHELVGITTYPICKGEHP
jgi:ABC-type multidrug transport system ATPase subunit